ncbi:MAG: right-handed parallel beta-helix repeat-containing protein, partial [Candidatus Omnitrophica bacterium]|nr:right-handed parallel beta-helix repeat-containing protein [Candidatus Omnitrophota bacterium]
DSGTDTGSEFNGEAPEIGSWEAPGYYNRSPIEPVPKRVFVNQAAAPGGDGLSWETAFQSVSEALFVYFVSNEVWVARGVYNENIYVEDTVSLYGGFGGWETVKDQRDPDAYPTVLDSSGLNTRVVTVNKIDGTTIDGFTIQGGGANQPGGGLHYYRVSSATLENCNILNNHSSGQDSGGGGVDYDHSQGIIAHCTFRNNSGRSGGAVAAEVSDVTLTDCLIDSNHSEVSGGGIYFRSTFGALLQCIIQSNSSLITGGGVSCYRSDPKIERCVISENTTIERGGGVYCTGGADPEIVHCSIVGNSAEFDGGAVYTYDSDPTITNCILWNPGDEIILGFSSRRSFPPVTTFSCVQGGFKGEGNIESYPRFVDPFSGDWRLLDG